ncbi:MAG: hypothetical protein MZW92_25845 [Comamonadaceae bacterium]|nr:hypothetical protein [Comamonadaceae bacterium]
MAAAGHAGGLRAAGRSADAGRVVGAHAGAGGLHQPGARRACCWCWSALARAPRGGGRRRARSSAPAWCWRWAPCSAPWPATSRVQPMMAGGARRAGRR